MASLTHGETTQSMLPMTLGTGNNSPIPVEANPELFEGVNARSETKACQVWAQGLEFVGLPGDTEKLQRKILSVVRNANAGSGGFIGCLALFSEQERRLVTVITLWTGEAQMNRDSEVPSRLKGLLEPYVDQWLRSSNFVTFLSVP